LNSDESRNGPDREADERIIEAMLRATHSAEHLDEERRIQSAMFAIRDLERTAPVAFSESVASPESVASRRGRWWIAALGGVGSIAALVVITILSQPSEVRAERIIARAKIAAESVESRRFDVFIESTVASETLDYEGWVELRSRPESHPLLRFEVEEPADQAYAWGVDDQGGWERTPQGLVSRFKRTEWSDRILGGGLDLLVDAIPAMLSRVEQGYDLIAATTRTMSPTLVATKRIAFDAKSPDRIRVEFDAETYEVSLLVLEWDQAHGGDLAADGAAATDQDDVNRMANEFSQGRTNGPTGPPARITFTRRATGDLKATNFDPAS
jgi:hypothetical protein